MCDVKLYKVQCVLVITLQLLQAGTAGWITTGGNDSTTDNATVNRPSSLHACSCQVMVSQ